MSHFDNAVDSHLQVADKLTIIGVDKTYQIAKDVDYKTISDAAPEFTVDEASTGIVEVNKTTGVVRGLKSGDTTVKISLPDNGVYLDATASITIKVRIEDTDQFNKNIERLADGDQILFAENANIELSDTLDLSGKKIAIKGEKGVVIVCGERTPILIDGCFELSNVEIDASSLKDPLVLMNTLPTTNLNDKGAYEIDKIGFDGVTVDGLKFQLFYANKQKYLINTFIIENSTINRVGVNKKSLIDFNGGGFPLNVTINKSTIESDATTQHQNGDFFTTQSGAKITDVTSDADAKHTFTVTNCKLTKIANGKTLCILRENNKAYQYYVVKDNVVANCGKSGQFLKGFCAGSDISKKENWTASGNVVTFDGVDKGADENASSGIEGACVVAE